MFPLCKVNFSDAAGSESEMSSKFSNQSDASNYDDSLLSSIDLLIRIFKYASEKDKDPDSKNTDSTTQSLLNKLDLEQFVDKLLICIVHQNYEIKVKSIYLYFEASKASSQILKRSVEKDIIRKITKSYKKIKDNSIKEICLICINDLLGSDETAKEKVFECGKFLYDSLINPKEQNMKVTYESIELLGLLTSNCTEEQGLKL